MYYFLDKFVAVAYVLYQKNRFIAWIFGVIV
jgi:hypothetical protein